jgi:Zn-dependent M28 family amino/carboxypeptidase
MWKIKTCLLLSVLVLGWSSCGDGKKDPNNGKPPVPQVNWVPVAPAFDADSAYAFIEKQLAFGPRVPNTKEHKACAAWFVSKFEGYGAQVTVQSATLKAWDNTPLDAMNIIAAFNPDAGRRILVSAHWDSRPRADRDPDNPNMPVPAANDGASGAAVLLEYARQFSIKAPAVGVDLILWDAEDYGDYENNNSWCLGSQYWSRNKHKANYNPRYGINLDMVGAKDARYYKDGYSMQYASSQVDHVWNLAHKLGYGAYFPLALKDMASLDDHYFIQEIAGIPMVEIIDRSGTDGEFFPHWHKTTDDINTIDKATLKATGQTVLEVIYREK